MRVQGSVGRLAAAALLAASTARPYAQVPTAQTAEIDRLLAEARMAAGRVNFSGEEQKAAEAAALSRTARDADRLIASLMTLGEATAYETRPAQCEAALREADGLASARSSDTIKAKIANGLGVCYRALSQFDDAIDSLRRAARAFGASGDQTNLARVQANISSLYRMLGEFNLLSADAYTDAIDLLIASGRVEDAFAISERQRARSFLDTLDERRNGIGAAVTADQQARETALAARGAAAQKELWTQNVTESRRRELAATLADTDDALDELHREIRRSDPRYANLRYPEMVTARDVVAMSGSDTVLLSYVLGEDRSSGLCRRPA
jgi:tetratricopeptide (TPR) repeat protein